MESNSTSVTDVIMNFSHQVSGVWNSCRLCMRENCEMQQIFSSEPDSISDRILFCTGVQFTKEDDLPSQICQSCLNQLSIAHQFKMTCLFADENYRKRNVAVKVEPQTNYEVGLFGYSIDPGKVKREGDKPQLNDLIKVESNFKKESTPEINRIQDDDNDDDIHCDDDVKMEDQLLEDVQPSDVTIMANDNESTTEPKPPIKTRKKRGPYNKSGKPRRLKKLKFSRLKCEACDIKFANKEESDKHKKMFHKGDESWICEICGKSFVHRASHYTHVRSHLPPQYACDQCDYSTCQKHDLAKHMLRHTGVKSYQCEFCTASYYTSSNLSTHIRRSHHGLKRFQCDLCERKFFDRTKLNRHLDSHNDIRRYECELCHSSYTRRCYWKKHLQRQHGIVVPAQRPGRQKLNSMVGELLTTSSLTSKFKNITSGAVNSDSVV